MGELSAILLELLQKHYRVSLPGIGAFVVKTEHARIDDAANTMLPPVKKVIFSKQETWNDGLLDAAYAARYGISDSEAQERVRHLMMDIQFELDDKGKVNFPKFGCLRHGKQNSIELEQQINLEERLGFGPISLGIAGAKRTAPRRESFDVGGMQKPDDALSGFSLNRRKITLVILAGLAGLAITFMIAFTIVRRTQNTDDLLPAKQPVSEKYTPPTPIDEETIAGEYEQPFEQQLDDPEYSPSARKPSRQKKSAAKNKTSIPQKPERQPQPMPAPSVPAVRHGSQQYCIVINSFTSRIAAEREVTTLKSTGYHNCHIAGVKDGRYRVSIGCYSDEGEARRILSRTKETVPDAWILTKN
jgi:nucleoid DNA-binding protein